MRARQELMQAAESSAPDCLVRHDEPARQLGASSTMSEAPSTRAAAVPASPNDSRSTPSPPQPLARGRQAATDLQPLLTLGEVAEILNVSPKTVRRLVARRGIPCVRLGRMVRFRPQDVFAWLNARRE